MHRGFSRQYSLFCAPVDQVFGGARACFKCSAPWLLARHLSVCSRASQSIWLLALPAHDLHSCFMSSKVCNSSPTAFWMANAAFMHAGGAGCT